MRCGCISASRSACAWSRRCWRRVASSSATRRWRQWALKFGQDFANRVRRRLPRAGDKWHHDEVAIKIAGVKHWLWHAVDQTGMVLDVLVQSRRDKRAAKRLLRKLLKRQCRAPRVMITDKLSSYGAAKWEVMPSVEHRQHKGLNNRNENSHQPTRPRERQTKRFKSVRQAQCFLSAYDQIANLFHLRRDQVSANEYRAARVRAFETWAEISSAAAATEVPARIVLSLPTRSVRGQQVDGADGITSPLHARARAHIEFCLLQS